MSHSLSRRILKFYGGFSSVTFLFFLFISLNIYIQYLLYYIYIYICIFLWCVFLVSAVFRSWWDCVPNPNACGAPVDVQGHGGTGDELRCPTTCCIVLQKDIFADIFD